MDASFESRLLEVGVGEDVIRVLIQQKVFSLRIFRAIKKDHLVKLFLCLLVVMPSYGSYGREIPTRTYYL